MGWWDYSSDSSWSWRTSRSPVRRRSGPTDSWGQWKCACGNIQSGSQCKGCHSKYWQVKWETVQSPSGKPGSPQATRAPWAKPDKPQPKASSEGVELLTHLDQFLAKANVPPDLMDPAMALRTELRLRAPTASERQKLKSVMDRIDHHKQQLHTIKKRLKEIEAERSTLEEQLAELEGGLGTLEQDKETLCTLVAAGGFDDSSSDTSSEPSEAGIKTRPRHRPMPS